MTEQQEMDNLATERTHYEEYPRSQFPGAIDNWDNMQDVSMELKPVVEQYERLWAQNDNAGLVELLSQNPTLILCLFNAEKYNQLLDGIKAVQKYYKEDVEVFLQNLAQITIGINDNAAGEDLITNTFSADKILRLITSTILVQPLTLLADNWSSTAPYKQAVSFPGITSNDAPTIGLLITEDADPLDVKAQKKAWGSVDRAVAEEGVIVFYCYNKKPTVNFNVNVKGV